MEENILNLLIANDHNLYGKGLGNAILKKGGNRFSINYTEDFQQTLDFLVHNKVDLLIIDFQMPKGDVTQTINTVRQNWPNIKIILNGMFMKSSLNYFSPLLPMLDGLLSFSGTEDDYINAIDVVMKGGLLFYIK